MSSKMTYITSSFIITSNRGMQIVQLRQSLIREMSKSKMPDG